MKSLKHVSRETKCENNKKCGNIKGLRMVKREMDMNHGVVKRGEKNMLR